MHTCLIMTLFALATCIRPAQGGGVVEAIPVVSEVVERAAKTYLENGQTIGVSIGVFKDGKTYTYNFGTTERGKTRPATERSRYPIASLTKTFTGALLAHAVVEGKLRLEDDVRRYLDGEYPNLEYQGKPILLWQLINHTSGLPRGLPENADLLIGGEKETASRRLLREAAFMDGYTRKDFLRDLHGVKLERVPGEKFSYSNTAVQLLGLVLERVYGKPFEELVRSRITGPLKMADTKVILSPTEAARIPKAYDTIGIAVQPAISTPLPAAGSLKSTVADMLKFLAWNVAEKDAVAKLTHQPAGNTVWSADGSFTVGLGWQIMTVSGRRVVFQDGNVPGYHSICVFYPELNLGIVVLSNEEFKPTPTRLSPLVNQILQTLDPRAPATP